MEQTRVRRRRQKPNRDRGCDMAEAVEHWTQRGADCWEWLGRPTVHGYGQLNWQGVPIRAHRASYLVHVGPIPRGLVVRHTCDNGMCVNPDHLRLGTHADNNADMVTRHRTTSPLTVDDVRDLRKQYQAGCTQVELAKAFGVTQATVSNIVRGKTWRMR